jgi:intraflagellar transport protein 52
VPILYPHGVTLNVQPPAVPLLSSGLLSYPVNRPLIALCSPSRLGHSKVMRGKDVSIRGSITVIGSVQMISDQYYDQMENMRLMEILLRLLTGDSSLRLNAIDAENPEVTDFYFLPDVQSMAEHPHACLQEAEGVPLDFTHLFDHTLYELDMRLVPEVVELYKKLEVDHKPLTLIPPEFEAPLPPLEPAVFFPSVKDLPPPGLDLFDLDEQFASEKLRLAQVTNKCESDDDVEYYVQECGDILGVNSLLPSSEPKDAKHILGYILKQIVQFRKLNADVSTSQPHMTSLQGSF